VEEEEVKVIPQTAELNKQEGLEEQEQKEWWWCERYYYCHKKSNSIIKI
jgi:hypothetical protein